MRRLFFASLLAGSLGCSAPLPFWLPPPEGYGLRFLIVLDGARTPSRVIGQLGADAHQSVELAPEETLAVRVGGFGAEWPAQRAAHRIGCAVGPHEALGVSEEDLGIDLAQRQLVEEMVRRHSSLGASGRRVDQLHALEMIQIDRRVETGDPLGGEREEEFEPIGPGSGSASTS